MPMSSTKTIKAKAAASVASGALSADFAIIKTGGKQYRVSAGDKLTIEKLAESEKEGSAGTKVLFEEVLLRSIGNQVEIGAPFLAGAKVEAKLLENFKEKTKIVFKYHSKARYKKKKGHRQPHTEVEILKI
jgi:large subunit ribosomal protein L21